MTISIHALRVEGDLKSLFVFVVYVLFLSTPSEWRATQKYCEVKNEHRYFYPRPPSGGRPVLGCYPVAVNQRFLSTPSEWRATPDRVSGCRSQCISIHALRVEGDCFFEVLTVRIVKFLSTPSEWRATADGGEVIT